MIRRFARFPLEMANGAKVRNIEDLRANADIESIIRYYNSGQLTRWCRAFGYEDLSEQLACGFVKNIYDTLGIPVETSEIETYVKENGIYAGSKTLNIAKEVNDKEIKNKIKPYLDSAFPLSNYSIELIYVTETLTVVRIMAEKVSSKHGFSYIYDSDLESQKDDDGLYQYIAMRVSGVHHSISNILNTSESWDLQRYTN